MKEKDVLIETYWNVKKEVPDDIMDWLDVLIETYWNVKISSNGTRKLLNSY